MKPITIAGGGLAGLALGIGLRRADVPVTLFEAGHYPRHRVCGEFINGQGRAALAELQLEEKMVAAGANQARTVAFFSRRVRGTSQALPRPALCLSRYVLDQLLADEFQCLGGILQQDKRWREPFGEGIIRATGRRTQPAFSGWRWFGLKVHARNVPTVADLEMHLFSHGYIGVCQLHGGEVNICGLFRSREAVPDLARTWRQWLSGPPGSDLHQRLARAEFAADSFCSIAGLPITAPIAEAHSECRVGDAITMIAPLTGNGMSMAFESAALALAPLSDYSQGKMTWTQTCQSAAALNHRHFRKRLRWSSWLQKALFHEPMAETLIRLAPRCRALWQTLFNRTR